MAQVPGAPLLPQFSASEHTERQREPWNGQRPRPRAPAGEVLGSRSTRLPGHRGSGQEGPALESGERAGFLQEEPVLDLGGQAGY